MDALERKTNGPVESRAEPPKPARGRPIPIPTTETYLKSEPAENTLLLLAEAVREAPPVERPRRPAEFVPRAVASVVDGCLLLFLWFLLFILSDFAVRALGLRVRFDSDWVLVGALITVALLYPCTEVFGAATPGKVLTRLRVVAPDGSAARTQVRLRRWAIRVSPLL